MNNIISIIQFLLKMKFPQPFYIHDGIVFIPNKDMHESGGGNPEEVDHPRFNRQKAKRRRKNSKSKRPQTTAMKMPDQAIFQVTKNYKIPEIQEVQKKHSKRKSPIFYVYRRLLEYGRVKDFKSQFNERITKQIYEIKSNKINTKMQLEKIKIAEEYIQCLNLMIKGQFQKSIKAIYGQKRRGYRKDQVFQIQKQIAIIRQLLNLGYTPELIENKYNQ